MQPFNFVAGNKVGTAIQLFNSDSEYLAGGTTLIDLMKLHVMTPTQLIDLGEAPLHAITDEGEWVEVGAMVSNNEMAHHPLIQENFPFVSEAILSGASVQLRNLATTAGNLLQRTRCSYFRDVESRCNKRSPGSGCDAIEGFNRMHAILGTSEACIASHPSDLCVALMAAEAIIVTQSSQGKREIPIQEFYLVPQQTPDLENVLRPGELILSVKIPKKSFLRHSTYVKIRDRSSYAFALTSAAVAIDLEQKLIKDVRIALGGVGTIPWRAIEAESILKGKSLSETTAREAARSVTRGALPREHNEFKIALIEQTLIRALHEVETRT